MKCANTYGSIIRPACYGDKAVNRVTVVYHENQFSPSGETSDSFELCGTCSDTLKRDAERHAYEVRVEGLSI